MMCVVLRVELVAVLATSFASMGTIGWVAISLVPSSILAAAEAMVTMSRSGLGIRWVLRVVHTQTYGTDHRRPPEPHPDATRCRHPLAVIVLTYLQLLTYHVSLSKF